MELTAKQRLFVHYYLGESRGNATDAARRADYRSPGVEGHRLLRNAKIRAAIDLQLDAIALTSSEILAQLSEVAQGGIHKFIKVDTKGNASLNFKQAKKDARLGLLRKFKQTNKGIEIETHDPLKALELLGKFRGLWDKPDPGHTGVRSPGQKVRDLLDGFDSSKSDIGSTGD